MIAPRRVGSARQQDVDDPAMAALGRDQKSGAPAIVGEIDRRPAGQKQLHRRKAVRLGDVVGVPRRPHERGEPVTRALVDGRASVEQATHHLAVAARSGIDERGFAGGVNSGGIGTAGEQQNHEFEVAGEGRCRKWGRAAAPGLISGHPLVEQEAGEGGPTGLGGEKERGRTLEVALVRVGAGLEQQARGCDVAAAGGVVERGVAATVARQGRGAALKERLHERATTLCRRLGELAVELAALLGRLLRERPRERLADAIAGRGRERKAEADERGRRRAARERVLKHCRSSPMWGHGARRSERTSGGDVTPRLRTFRALRVCLMTFIQADYVWGEARMSRRSLGLASALAALALSLAYAAQAGQGFAIVSNEKSGNFTVFDLDGNVLRTVPACGRPRGMVFTLDRQQFLVCCAEDNMIGVFDTHTQKLVRRLPNVLYPEVHYLHPNGRYLLVSNEEDSQASLFDLETGQQIAAFDTGPEPEGAIITPDGKLGFVVSEAANLLHVIDLEKGEIIKDLVMNTRPRRLALTPDGKELWVSAEIAGMVDIVDVDKLELVHTIEFEYRGLRKENITPVDVIIDSKGERAYVALGRANHVAVVDVKTRKVTDYVLVGRRAWGLALNRDETRLWVANGLSDDITIIDTRTLKPLKSVPAGEVPHSILIFEP